jgi:peptidoglycan/xylan/chitin deacetylase (PgdA/CDA1 family)
MTTAGHELASHLETHTAPDLLSPCQLRAELDQVAKRIELAASISPRLVRPPYGNAAERVARIAHEFDLGEVVLWSVDPRDWSEVTPRTITRRVLVRARPGDIILLHDRPFQEGCERWRRTIASIEELIPALRERGYEFVTVSELLASRRPRRSRQASLTRPFGRSTLSDVKPR